MRLQLSFASFWGSCLCLGGIAFLCASARAADPLHSRIDALLEKGQPAGQAALAGDAEFLRRATLALHGIIPSTETARAFLADQAPDKRARLIDTLLADRQYARWMAVRFDVMLMERRGETHTKAAPWRAWLEESFAANRPWNDLVRDLIENDGSDEKTRHLARWTLERDADPNALTRDVGRLFLGQDISCSQCHDHPRVDDYLQRDYAGIQAFFNRTYLFRPDTKKPGVIGEQAAGDLSFQSVFTKAGGMARPRLPGQADLADLAEPETSGQWIVEPNPKDKNLRPIPKHSRRALLAHSLALGGHPQFRRNIANRLWSIVFGRGLVEPLEMDHSGNPAAHPDLMNLLAEEIAALKFDTRAFIRELALTRAFQRSLDLPSPAPGDAAKLAARLAELEKTVADREKAASAATETYRAALKQVVEASLVSAPFLEELTKADTDIAAAQKAADEALKAQKPFDEKVAPLKKPYADAVAALKKVNDDVGKAGTAPTPPQIAAKKAAEAKVAAAEKALKAAESAAAAKQAVTAEKTKLLNAAKAKATAAKVGLAESEKAVAALQLSVDETDRKKQTLRVEAMTTAQTVAELRAALAWNAVQTGSQSPAAALPKPDPVISAANAKKTALLATITDKAHAFEALEARATAAQAAAVEAEKAVAAASDKAAALRKATEKTQEVVALVPDHATMKQVAATLKAHYDAGTAALTGLAKAAAAARASAEVAAKTLTDARAAQTRARAELAVVEKQLAAKQAVAAVPAAAPNADEAREALAAAWSRSFAAMDLVPLTPEQLAWSLQQASGVTESYKKAAYADWDKKNKFTEADKANAAKMKEREAAVSKAVFDKLAAQESTFVRFFGGAPGQPQTDFFATPEQALFFENGGTIRAWAATLASRAAAKPDTKAAAEELYLSTLTRLPEPDEIAILDAELAGQPANARAKVLGDAAWALLTSVEFRFSF